jgi:lysophospholipase L1-like esterase
MSAILCFGDSITFGEGYDGGWCGYLKKWFENSENYNQVYNLGINGQRSSDLLERFDTETKARLRFREQDEVYLTIIAIGTNDSKYSGSISDQNVMFTEEQFKQNILELIQKAKSFKQKILFLGLPPVDESRTLDRENGTVLTNERVTKFNNIIKTCCKNEDLPFLDLNKIILKKDYKVLFEDGLHPNKKGYRFIFTKIRAFMKKNNLFP